MLQFLRALTLTSISLITACSALPGPEYGAGGSTTKEINIAIPKLEAFTPDAALQAKITGYRMSITSTDEKCTHKDPYVSKISDAKISATILKACDYQVELDFGSLSDDGLTLAEAYFSGEASLTQAEIAKQTAGGTNTVGLEIILAATELGRALGFTGEVKIESATLDVSVKIQNHTQPVDAFDIKDYPEKYKASKTDLSEYGKKYIEIMNKLDFVSNTDQLKFHEVSQFLADKVYIFDMHLVSATFTDPKYKSFRFMPVATVGDQIVGSKPKSDGEYELMTSVTDVTMFQPLALKFQNVAEGSLVRVKVKIISVGFLGTKISADLLEVDVL